VLQRDRSNEFEIWNHPAAIACILFALAVLLRYYRLGSNLLWLDELYGYQLTQLGPGPILRTSLLDEHPPLYNLIAWVTSGFGLWHTPWVLRWPAALAGAVNIPFFYLLASKLANKPSALVTAFMLAISSGQVFYSQEARPYTILILLATLSAWLLTRIQEHPANRMTWWWHTIALLVGCWSGYTFVLIAVIQIVWLLLTSGIRSRAVVHAAIVGVCCLPLIALALNPLAKALVRYASDMRFRPVDLVALLLARNTRHDELAWFPLLLTIVAVVGALCTMRRGWAAPEIYFVVQVLLPFIFYFAIAQPLLHIYLPNWEARQFLVLVPSFFMLVALGADWVYQRLPRQITALPLIALCICAIFVASVDLQRYWAKQKSPEAVAVLMVRDELHPDDAVVSLNGAMNAALSFYFPAVVPYTYPKQVAGGYVFSRSTSVVVGGPYTPDSPAPFSQVEQHGRIWLMWSEFSGRTAVGDGVRQALTSSCQTRTQRSFGEYRLLLLDACRTASGNAPLLAQPMPPTVASVNRHIGWEVNGAGAEGGSITLCGESANARRSSLRTITQSNPLFPPIPIYLSRFGLRVWEG
jgi:hypothetical protein